MAIKQGLFVFENRSREKFAHGAMKIKLVACGTGPFFFSCMN